MSYFCLQACDNRRTDRASNGCPVKCHALSAPQSSTGGPLWDRGQTQGLRCCYWCCRCSVCVRERARERVRERSRCDLLTHTELLLCPSYSVFLWVCPCPQPLTATARNCEKKTERAADIACNAATGLGVPRRNLLRSIRIAIYFMTALKFDIV